MLVALTNVKLKAATPPIVTEFTPVKSVPVMLMVVFPLKGPMDGRTLLMTGAGGATTVAT